ncbi:MAG: response regulator transcription factor [Betaproteobacteria bacterium]|nr:response regulator transcription factor [Betaproteobacteria bacterium]MDE2623039.1 response regulator transcription factor [Betaproteobacteria bacterium]
MKKNQRVYVVDDDEAVRHSLIMLLETAGYTASEFASGEAFLASCSENCEGCVILDVHMPGMDGVAVYQALQAKGRHPPVIFLTAYGTIPMSVKAIKSGALDYLTKPVDGTLLLERVQEALRQDERLRAHDAVNCEMQERLASLTSREHDVMTLAVAGFTNKEIAQRLQISHRTVEIHRARVMHKTGATNLLELARIAENSPTPPPA